MLDGALGRFWAICVEQKNVLSNLKILRVGVKGSRVRLLQRFVLDGALGGCCCCSGVLLLLLIGL